MGVYQKRLREEVERIYDVSKCTYQNHYSVQKWIGVFSMLTDIQIARLMTLGKIT